MVKAKDIMTRDVITVLDTAPIMDAIKLLVDKNISGLPVVSKSMKLLGIITEKDLLKIIDQGKEPEGIVNDHMTKNAFTVDENVDLQYVCECLIGKNIKRVPVTSGSKLAGIISRRDMIRHLIKA